MTARAQARLARQGFADVTKMFSTTATAHPLDFSQLSGREFERLAFAFLCRRWPWQQIDWFGQVGSDGGRDIWGLRESDSGGTDLVVVVCANWRRLTAGKAKADIDKIIGGTAGIPRHLIVLAGDNVSPKLKSAVVSHAKSAGIQRAEVWSGAEFEEHLRTHAESVLRRFFAGEVFPDEPLSLRTFASDAIENEDEALRLLGRLFDRPAFQTPFQSESSLPAFRRAISDTIEALNTGIYRCRDGTVIRRLPAKADFPNVVTRAVLDSIVHSLNRLRMLFDEHYRDGTIRPCGCAQSDCHIFMIDRPAADALDRVRRQVLDRAGQIIPGMRTGPDD